MSRKSPPQDRLKRVVSGSSRNASPPIVRSFSGGEPRPLPKRKAVRDGKLEKMVGGVAIGLMLLAGIVYVNERATRTAGRTVESQLERHWRNINAEYSDDFIPRRKSGDQEATDKLRERCRTTPKLRHGDTSVDFMLPHAEARTIALGEFVECVLQRDRHRLCDAKERQIAAADIAHFSTMRAKHARLIQDLGREAKSGFAVTAMAITGDLDYARSSLPIVDAAHADVVRAVRSTVEQGYLSAKDFARGGPPADLASAFKISTPVEKPCK